MSENGEPGGITSTLKVTQQACAMINYLEPGFEKFYHSQNFNLTRRSPTVSCALVEIGVFKLAFEMRLHETERSKNVADSVKTSGRGLSIIYIEPETSVKSHLLTQFKKSVPLISQISRFFNFERGLRETERS